MKIYYTQKKKIIKVLYEKDIFGYDLSTLNPDHSVFEIEEIDPANKDICIDVTGTSDKVDKDGLNKYYIENNELHVRDNWEEFIEEYD